MILAQLEQRQLLGGLLGLGSRQHNEAIRLGPADGLVAEFAGLHPRAGTDVPEMRQLALDPAGQARHDHEAPGVRFQPLDGGVGVKPLVCADYDRADPAGDFRKAGLEKVQRSGRGVNIARSQLAMPEVLRLPLEAEQGVIGGAAALDRVVANARSFLLAIDHQHGEVQIEDEPRRHSWSRPVIRAESSRAGYATCPGQRERSAAKIVAVGRWLL